MRPLVPLAVCCLLLLALTDHFFPHLLCPSRNPIFESLVGDVSIFEGRIAEDPVVTEDGVRFLLTEDRAEFVLVTVGVADPLWRDSIHREDRVRFMARLKKPVRYANPGGFDYRRFLERKGIFYTAYVAGPESIQILEKAAGFAPVVSFRDRVRRVLAEAPGETGNFLRALVLGEAQLLSESLRENFQITGTSHVVAISGQHVGLLAGFFFLIFFAIFRRSERLALTASVKVVAWAAATAPTLFYTVLAGAPPSAVRAMILLVLFVAALIWARELDPLSALSFGAVVIAVSEPSAIFSASFQLSFLALLGILLFVPAAHDHKKEKRLWKYLILPLLMTLGATMLTAPLIAYRFHQVSWSGFLINLWAIPAASALLIAALIGITVALVVPVTQFAVVFFLGKLTAVFLSMIAFSAWLTQKTHLVSEFYPTEGEMFWVYVGIICILVTWKFSISWKKFCAAMVTFVFLMSFFLWRPSKDLEVVFLDVGQGDCALILTPEGRSLLVDGGGFLIRRSRFDVGRDVVAPYLKRRGVKRLDGILLSHPHPDHFGGLAAVVEEFAVGEFWWNGQSYPGPEFEELTKVLDKKNINPKILRAGDNFSWNGLDIKTVYPEKALPTRNMNDNSLVVQVSWRNAKLLFAGDIESLGERTLSDRVELKSDILKIPHHGSRTSSSVPFIDTVNPKIAVASLSDGNTFGFPHPGILEKYIRRETKVFRTDRDGAVTVFIPENYPQSGFHIEAMIQEK